MNTLIVLSEHSVVSSIAERSSRTWSPVEERSKMTSEGFLRLNHLVGGHCCAAWRTRSTIAVLLSSSMPKTIT
jgi:hypothetical protein